MGFEKNGEKMYPLMIPTFTARFCAFLMVYLPTPICFAHCRACGTVSLLWRILLMGKLKMTPP